MMLEVAIAFLAGDKCWPLVGGVFRFLVSADMLMWTVGLMLGLTEIPMKLQTTSTHAGTITFSKALSRTFFVILLSSTMW
jgi:hypothetical protein